jgi:transposase-like protein
MGKANFTEDFKRDAVLQITERGAIRLPRRRRGWDQQVLARRVEEALREAGRGPQ